MKCIVANQLSVIIGSWHTHIHINNFIFTGSITKHLKYTHTHSQMPESRNLKSEKLKILSGRPLTLNSFSVPAAADEVSQGSKGFICQQAAGGEHFGTKFDSLRFFSPLASSYKILWSTAPSERGRGGRELGGGEATFV